MNGNRQPLAVGGTDGRLAYQAIAGAAFPIDEVPGLSATAECRFMGTMVPEHGATLFTRTGRNQAGQAEINPYHHAVLFGLRYSLGGLAEPMPAAPALSEPPMAAPPPVAAAPAPARSFIVRFGLKSASLTARARQIVAEAARSGTARIEVGGHADTVGSPAANQRLSMRRAEVVAAELRRQGLRSEEIRVTAFGETESAVATRDGVREPRNRRVDIVLRSRRARPAPPPPPAPARRIPPRAGCVAARQAPASAPARPSPPAVATPPVHRRPHRPPPPAAAAT